LHSLLLTSFPLILLYHFPIYPLSVSPAVPCSLRLIAFSLFLILNSSFLILHYLSPALRNATICRSNTAGSLIGMRCLCTASEKLGLSRSTSVPSFCASAACPNSLYTVARARWIRRILG